MVLKQKSLEIYLEIDDVNRVKNEGPDIVFSKKNACSQNNIVYVLIS